METLPFNADVANLQHHELCRHTNLYIKNQYYIKMKTNDIKTNKHKFGISTFFIHHKYHKPYLMKQLTGDMI